MKIAIFLISLFTLMSSFAATEQEAIKLFSKRGENSRNALLSANIYKKLAASAKNSDRKSFLLVRRAASQYFYSMQLPKTSGDEKQAKLDSFQIGYESAIAASNLIASKNGQAKSTKLDSQLAEAYYWYAANLGQWGTTKGLLSILKKWPQMKKYLLASIALDPTIEFYGSHRIIGRSFMKSPKESDSEGLRYLEAAWNNTLVEVDGLTVSKSAMTGLFYLDILREVEEIDTFCETYDLFTEFKDAVEADHSLLKVHNDKMMPETLNVFKDFENEKDFKDIHKFFNKEC